MSIVTHIIAFLAGIAIAVPFFHVSATSVKSSIDQLRAELRSGVADVKAKLGGK